MASGQSESPGSLGRTAWARNLTAPVRSFLSTETGGAMVLLAATIVALLWANSPWSDSYTSLWTTRLSITIGGDGISADLREWVNQGLMTFFFLVVGLEAKRELDLGELRERRRLAIPAFAAVGGMVVAVAIYLAFNAGGPGAHGWGAAMSTDTAFALGAIALLTPRAATRTRVFLLSLAVVDDLCALLVIAIAYTDHVSLTALAVAVGFFAVLLGLRYAPLQSRRPVSVIVAIGLWVAMFESGIDPVISGLAVGLATTAYPPSRDDLERATALARSFREQPTPELARSAKRGVLAAVSPNERLQYALHPWTSYVIVPVFALANTGVRVTGGLLSDAIRSPITLGIFFGYVVGKPLGIASLAFEGQRLDEAKLGALATVAVAPAVAWVVLRIVRHLPAATRARQIAGTAEDLLDLSDEPNPARDHIRGPEAAPVTLVEYGDFECEYCGQAQDAIRELLAARGEEVRYVWRHLPLNDVHSHAQLAAEAAEAAADQGRFWEMHDVLLNHQGELRPMDVARYAQKLGLQRGRRERRRERRLRDADVLRQRPAPSRRLRHRHAHRDRAWRARARAPHGAGMRHVRHLPPRDTAILRMAGGRA